MHTSYWMLTPLDCDGGLCWLAHHTEVEGRGGTDSGSRQHSYGRPGTTATNRDSTDLRKRVHSELNRTKGKVPNNWENTKSQSMKGPGLKFVKQHCAVILWGGGGGIPDITLANEGFAALQTTYSALVLLAWL